ncbi:MAG: methyltransferase [Lachnospiraceae bacterium]|nr:methyltransferase [Lachnospiraceae bacterium]
MKDHSSEKWYQYLYYTDNRAVNIERVETVSGITGHETLDYVLRSLRILEGYEGNTSLSAGDMEVIRKVLCWSEVAKGGSARDRAIWEGKGYPLDIHNIASAEIYMEEEGACDPDRGMIHTLIRTHGMIGQCLRGEVSVSENAPLRELGVEKERLFSILSILNECIIRAVSDELWERVRPAVLALIDRILEGDLKEFTAEERIRRLLPGLTELPEKLIGLFAEKLLPHYELWYFEAALSDFDAEQIFGILSRLPEGEACRDVCYISFKPLSDSLYYDYEGKKHINIYKKRIIEKHLRDSSVENVTLSVRKCGSALLVDFEFSRVCEKLIDFCVEAERCGLLSFEKSITVLYDMFGFRRDEFDRLNNEEKYLATMNSSEESTKNSIIDYVCGQTVVDVGSGGGVLLDLLEERYPDKTVIGTDISENVIDILNKKKHSEGHRWTVQRHNFVDGPISSEGEKVDTVIFSSIIHEIFSYTETEEGRFNIEVVKTALKNAYASLNSGGRIVIRDGIKMPEDKAYEIMKLTFKEASGLEFFRNYMRDFEGLKDMEDKKIRIEEESLTVSACADFIREFLYTYTWGQESYSHEVNEQFGYFTIDAYREFLESLGAEMIRADSFLEPGYPEHLRPLVTLDPDVFPDSNCILVAEKP